MTVISKTPTREQIVTELAEVRARVEQVKKQAKELGMRYFREFCDYGPPMDPK